MKSLNIKSNNGNYEIITSEINTKEIGYIIINSGDNFTVLEAIDLMKKYNPKKIYITYNCNIENDYPYSFSVYEYEYKYILTKSYKDIKLVLVDLNNRNELLDMINSNTRDILSTYTLDNYDIMDMVHNKNTYYFIYKKEYIGCASINGDLIDYFIIKKQFRNQGLGSMCLSKLLYKLNKDTKVLLSSDNKEGISFFEKNAFIKTKIVNDWYEVLDEKKDNKRRI